MHSTWSIYENELQLVVVWRNGDVCVFVLQKICSVSLALAIEVPSLIPLWSRHNYEFVYN